MCPCQICASIDPNLGLSINVFCLAPRVPKHCWTCKGFFGQFGLKLCSWTHSWKSGQEVEIRPYWHFHSELLMTTMVPMSMFLKTSPFPSGNDLFSCSPSAASLLLFERLLQSDCFQEIVGLWWHNRFMVACIVRMEEMEADARTPDKQKRLHCVVARIHSPEDERSKGQNGKEKGNKVGKSFGATSPMIRYFC